VSVSGDFALVRDGGQVLIRPLVPRDRAGVASLFARLSGESRALRFHSGGVRIDDRTLDIVTAGHALVVERDGRIVALASYYPLRDPARAEMAIAVDDAAHGRGIGTVLFERLSEDARRAGIRTLLAEVLAANRGMLGLLTGLGFRTSRRFDGGVVEVEVEVTTDPAYRARADARLHVAASASLEPIFRPRAVAVIGASRRPGAPGHELFRHLLAGGFAGAVYPVNPAASAVASVRAYPTVAAIPEPVDLAVIAVPAPAVLEAARACLDAGVRGLVVVSAGFTEVGDEGRRRQDALVRLCRERGARLIGPHSMGVLVTDVDGAGGALNATFAPALPPRGAVAISAQSGVLGLALLEHARRLGLGVSAFVSLGAKADVSSNDLLERWEDDPATSVILLYLESFGNPRRFARIARRVGARTPILAVKGGRATVATERGAVAHTDALAGADVAVDALFRQSGVTRCDTLEELFDAALLLASQPLPRGNRVGILTNVSGLGVLCADACAAAGLELPVPSETTQTALRELMIAGAPVANPIGLPATVTASDYGAALRHVLVDAVIDAAIVLFIPPLGAAAGAVAAALRAACDPPPTKPVLCCFDGVQGLPAALRGATSLPSYTYPEAAARTLGHAAARAVWLRRAAGQIPSLPGIDAAAGRAVVDRALAREERPWLGSDEVRDVLRAYGVAMLDQVLVHTPAEAADACCRLGAPVALTRAARGAPHTPDGGVRLAVASPEAAAAAYRDIEATLVAHGRGEAMDGALVQPMAPDGVECLVGVVTDPVFGPLVAFGLGGVAAEIIGDIAFRVHPLTDVDAEELIANVKGSRLLQGYGGRPPADVRALREVLLRVSRLVEDVPEIDEIAINPIMVRDEGQGAVALDARIRLRRGDT